MELFSESLGNKTLKLVERKIEWLSIIALQKNMFEELNNLYEEDMFLDQTSKRSFKINIKLSKKKIFEIFFAPNSKYENKYKVEFTKNIELDKSLYFVEDKRRCFRVKRSPNLEACFSDFSDYLASSMISDIDLKELSFELKIM
ncbi:MAG: hypothetical protein ACRCX2_28820 [Paraclostridium sp.]